MNPPANHRWNPRHWLPLTRAKILGARVLYHATTLFTGKEKRIITRDEVRYEVDLAEGIELSLFLFGRFQSHVTDNPFLRLDPAAVIVDIGANVGLMTLRFAKMVPQGRVYSFEPTFYALERLKRNLSLNPDLAPRVTVVNSFVSAKSDADPGIVAYSSWRLTGDRGGSDHPVHLGTPKPADGVPSVSLDDFADQQRLTRIDFIKVDTDGHEYEVFRGARRTLARFRPLVIFEIGLYVMEEKGIGFDFYQEYFDSLNYRLVDAASRKEVNLANHRSYIPGKGSIDLVALPLEPKR